MSAELLPQNATPLEKALAGVLDTRGRLAPELARVPTLTMDPDTIPEDWLPWVIADEGLSILSPFLAPREVLREGRKWKQELGSAAAIIRALSWVGQTDVKIHCEPDEDEHFDLFQVELQSPVSSLAEAARIAELIRISKPTTDILGRVKSGLDGDPFRLDHSILDGPDMLDDWIGTRVPGLGPETPDGPITWTFGDMRSFNTEGGAASVSVQFCERLLIGAPLYNGFMLDISNLDEDSIEPQEQPAQMIFFGVTAINSDDRMSPHPHAAHPGHAPTEFRPTVAIEFTRKE